ncbi:MAG: anthranilate phosphoribosyltransferase [Planctomycetes bacterium]|nr:anthranilate phosphoribosyltransferase [Planctomycetota bacterium]
MTELSHSSLLSRVIAGNDLTEDHARWAFDQIMDGNWTEAQIAALLVGLAAKGETVGELSGAAGAMRAHAVLVDTGGAEVVDTCGTGGTGISTFNISTAAGIVAAGAGVCVAKHGNRTNTRASGSADVLAALGVNIECNADTEARCLKDAGICFSFAVKHHPAMKYAGPVRKQLGVRTIFNVLGPLTNPAGARRQVMGVPSDPLTETIAGVLRALGAERAMVVHSADGLDEISTTAPTTIADLCDGEITVRVFDTTDLGLPRANLDDLLIDSAEASAAVIRDVLAGKQGPARDIVAVNAAAVVVVAGLADDLPGGIAKAIESIDTGEAARALAKLIAFSNDDS